MEMTLIKSNGKEELGWRWLSRQFAEEVARVCRLKQLKYGALYEIECTEGNQLMWAVFVS